MTTKEWWKFCDPNSTLRFHDGYTEYDVDYHVGDKNYIHKLILVPNGYLPLHGLVWPVWKQTGEDTYL